MRGGVFPPGEMCATAGRSGVARPPPEGFDRSYMKQFLITAAGVFAGLMIFMIGVPFVLISMAANAAGPAPIPARTVLELDLRDPLTDQSPKNPLLGFGRGATSVMSIIEGLRRAEDDAKVKALLVRLPEDGMEPGMADELRLAILHFRTSGKPVIAHSQGLYPAGVITSTTSSESAGSPSGRMLATWRTFAPLPRTSWPMSSGEITRAGRPPPRPGAVQTASSISVSASTDQSEPCGT